MPIHHVNTRRRLYPQRIHYGNVEEAQARAVGVEPGGCYVVQAYDVGGSAWEGANPIEERQSDAVVSERPQGPRDATGTNYALLRQHVIQGRFPPGSVLLETALSAQYGVSRTPMREALNRLAQDGLIERSTRGFRVRVRTPEEIVDIYEARIALESACAGLAAARRSEFDLARLAHLLEERGNVADPTSIGKLNNAWHDALRMAAHNTTIMDLLARVDTLLELYRSKRTVHLPDQQVDEHESILAAIRDRDADAAQEAMRDHLRHVRERRIAELLAEAADPAGP